MYLQVRGTRWCSWLRHCAYNPGGRRFDYQWYHRNFVMQSGSLNLLEASGPEQGLLHLFIYR